MLPTQGYGTGFALATQGYGAALIWAPTEFKRPYITLDINEIIATFEIEDIFAEVREGLMVEVN